MYTYINRLAQRLTLQIFGRLGEYTPPPTTQSPLKSAVFCDELHTCEIASQRRFYKSYCHCDFQMSHLVYCPQRHLIMIQCVAWKIAKALGAL